MKFMSVPGIICMIIVIGFSGCSKIEHYGITDDPSAVKITIAEALAVQEKTDTLYTIKGKITKQCKEDKCWLYLSSDDLKIYVDLKPGKITIPAAVGKTAVITGTLYPGEEEVLMYARGLTLQ